MYFKRATFNVRCINFKKGITENRLIGKSVMVPTYYHAQARLNLGLNYLAKGDFDEANEVFEALANDITSYGENAKSILDEI